MPIRTPAGATALPLDDAGDVADLMELARRPDTDTRWVGDHLSLLAGTRPDLFRPYQHEALLTGLLDRHSICFDDLCVLLAGAPDECLDAPLDDLLSLAAIGTPAALTAIAEDVRAGGDREAYASCGIWVPPTGPAQHRFSPERRAIHLRTVADRDALAAATHPVGLTVGEVAVDPSVSWHYLSVRLADVPGAPDWPAERAHLVGVRASCMWTVQAGIDEREGPAGEDVIRTALAIAAQTLRA